MNRITSAISPDIICCSLDKKLWVEKYPRKLFFKDDPYEEAFVYLLERYADFLNSKHSDQVTGNYHQFFSFTESAGFGKNYRCNDSHA